MKINGFKINLKRSDFELKDSKYSIKTGEILQSIVIDKKVFKRFGKDIMYFTMGGYWRQISETEFIRLVGNYTRTERKKIIKNKSIKPLITDNQIKDVINDIYSDMDEWVEEMEIINSQMDGYYKIISKSKVIKISTNGDYTTEKNNGKYYNFLALNDFDLNEDLELPKDIDDFFNDISVNDNEVKDYLQELTGHCLIYGHIAEPYIYFLDGIGKNGKSIYIELLKRITGYKTSSINFTDLNPVNFERLESTFINLPSELDGNKTIPESTLKAITSGDSVERNPKYKNSRNIFPISKQIRATNKLPPLTDSTEGLWRRIQVIPFLFRVKNDTKKDPIYFKKLFQDYEKEILNWAFKGRIRLIKNKGVHTHSKVIRNRTNKYNTDENSIVQFKQDILATIYNEIFLKKEKEINGIKITSLKSADFEFRLKLKDLYTLYNIWCKSYGYKNMNFKNMTNKIYEMYDSSFEIENHRGIKSIFMSVSDLVEEYEDVFEEGFKEF